MEKDYLSISEYSKLKGVTYQAVYKKLNGIFEPFVVVVNGHKMLKKSILEENFFNKSSTDNFNKIELSSTKSLTDEEESLTVEKNSSTSASAQAEIERINRRNEEIIDDLRAQLKDKDAQIKEMNDKIISLFETNQRLLENNQSLQLNYQMLLGATADATKEVINADENEESAPVENDIINQPEEKQTKKGFWQRLFNL